MFNILFDFLLALGLCLSIYPSQVVGVPKIELNVTVKDIPYEAPGNVKFPLSDEDENDSENCKEKFNFPEIEYPPCGSDEQCPDPHVPCDEFEQDKQADPLISCCEGKIIPETKCLRCNLNIPPNGAPGVLLSCQECVDSSGCCKKDIKAYAKFISIPSYYKNETIVDNRRRSSWRKMSTS